MEEEEGEEWGGASVVAGLLACWLAVKLINHTHQTDKWHFSCHKVESNMGAREGGGGKASGARGSVVKPAWNTARFMVFPDTYILFDLSNQS